MSVLDTFETVGRWALPVVIVRASVLLTLLFAAGWAARRRSASARHALLALGTATLLALPLLSGNLPRLELGLLPESSLAPRQVDRAAGRQRTAASERETVAAAPTETPRQPIAAPVPAAARPARDHRAAAERPALPSPADSAARVSWWALFAFAWLAGVGVGLLRFAWAARLVRRVGASSFPVTHDGWLDDLALLRARLGVAQPVRLLASARVAMPIVYGHVVPSIVLPLDAQGWPEPRRRAVLLHELAHVGRRDYLTQTLARLARLFYWPNPLAWWLVAHQRAESERACDDAVVAFGVPAPEYAALLVDLARRLSATRGPAGVLAAVEGSQFEGRLMALLDSAVPRHAVTRGALALALACAAALVATVAAVEPGPRSRPAAITGAARQDQRPSTTSIPAQTAAVPLASLTPHVTSRSSPPASQPEPKPSPRPSPEDGVATTLASPAEPIEVASPAAPAAVSDGAPRDPVPVPTDTRANASVPVIRISTEIVQVDAVITDKRGAQVTDLRPEDFEVSESGRRREVTQLAYVRTGRAPEGSVPEQQRSALVAPRTLVFLVDDLGLSFESSVQARKLLTEFARAQEDARARIAILTTSGTSRGAQLDWTLPEDLLRTASSLRFNLQSRARGGERIMGGRPSWGGAVGFTTVGNNPASGSDLNVSHLFGQHGLESMAAIKRTIEALRSVPGRKGLVVVSEGFSSLPSADPTYELRSYTTGALDALYGDWGQRAALSSLTDLANRSSVVLYAINPLGLAPPMMPSAESESGFDTGPLGPAQEQRRLLRVRKVSLAELSEPTGGFVIADTNDLAGGLDRILGDQAGYYLIGYEPDRATFEAKGGRARFHKLEVSVKRRGLRVRSRQGFYGVSDERIAATVN